VYDLRPFSLAKDSFTLLNADLGDKQLIKALTLKWVVEQDETSGVW
jgi:hypothetical protein